MMNFWVELGDGTRLKLPKATRWKLCYGTGLPCDSFEVRCLWDGDPDARMSAAALFYAEQDGERLFTGVVDEYAFVCGNGTWLELSGRSMAARLLDNEAMPAQYQKLTCADLLERHVKPYGVETVGGGQLPAVSGFSVTSGVSEWSVVENYAQYYGGVIPRFDRLGRLVLEPHKDTEPLELGDGAPITRWELREQRYGVLSSVAVRRRTDWGVQWVEDRDFIAQGGCARRVISVPNETGTAAMRYSADYQLRASRSERLRLTVTLSGAFFIEPGRPVKIGRVDPDNRLWRVARTEVSCGEQGLTTVVELGEPDAMI